MSPAHDGGQSVDPPSRVRLQVRSGGFLGHADNAGDFVMG
jgi:hypothetical protein